MKSLFWILVAFSSLSIAHAADLLPPPVCPNGTVVPMGYDAKGCEKPLKCVDLTKCRVYSAPLCGPGQQAVSVGRFANGCEKPAKCVDVAQCPVYSAPLCQGGTIVVPGKRNDGCDKAPVCVMPNQCPVN